VRILILNWKDLSHPAAGGAEVLTEQVARALVARGHSLTLFAAAVDGKPEREVVAGVEIIRRGGRLGVYRAARSFWRTEGHGAYDIVVDEINTRPFLTPRWIHDTPIVALIHQLAREIWFDETPLPVAVLGRYVLEPWWLRSYRNVPALTVSASSAGSLARHHGWRNVTVIPEGSDPHPVPQLEKEGEPTVVFLGRLVAMKQPEDAIEAFRVLAGRYPAAQLWMIGDGPRFAALRAESRVDVAEREPILLACAEDARCCADRVHPGPGLAIALAARELCRAEPEASCLVFRGVVEDDRSAEPRATVGRHCRASLRTAR